MIKIAVLSVSFLLLAIMEGSNILTGLALFFSFCVNGYLIINLVKNIGKAKNPGFAKSVIFITPFTHLLIWAALGWYMLSRTP